MATPSSILAWEIPWTEESGRLEPTGLQRVSHDWAQHIPYTYFYFLQNSIFHIAMSYHSLFYATFPSRSISPNHDLPDLCVVVAKLCLTLCNPLDCSPSGSSDCEISQARILEGVAISFSTHLFSNSKNYWEPWRTFVFCRLYLFIFYHMIN